MKTSKPQIYSIIGLIFFVLIAFASFDNDDNSKEAQEARENLKKEGFKFGGKDSSKNDVEKIDKSLVIGKWVYTQLSNTEQATVETVKPNYNQPYEYTPDGKYYCYDLNGNKLVENYKINNDKLTYIDENNKKREWVLRRTTKDVLVISPSNMMYLYYKYEKILTSNSDNINPKAIFGKWEQYKFVNKANNAIVDGPTYSMDGLPTLMIFKQNNELFVGSSKNNSKEGTFRVTSNKLTFQYDDGKTDTQILLKLSDKELIYFLKSDKNLVYYFKKIED